MKKALALVLALVLALSMAVSAFAADVVTLEPVKQASATRTPIVVVPFDTDEDGVQLVANKAGTYYIALDKDVEYTDIAVTATGIVSASVVDFDASKMYLADNNYEDITRYKIVLDKGGVETLYQEYVGYYKDVCDTADKLNKDNNTTEYKVKVAERVYVIKLVVEENYSASYKAGSIKVTANQITRGADNKITKKTPVAGNVDVISDVILFNYEEVKSAALYNKDGEMLTLGSAGYSAYETSGKYGTSAQTAGAKNEGALVVPTTAFRAIEGKNLTVELGHNGEDYVTIKNVAAGQKGVNFACSDVKLVDANGYTEALCDYYEIDFVPAALTFEFLGDQVIKSEFEIVFGCGDATWFDLREAFGIELEEEDIITYYVLKDGKVIDSITIDYMTVDYNEEIELVIKGENTNLGSYELRLDVPAAEVETETEANPNTGAESVVGVVAALAVVSLASAAAVSLKK